MPFETCEIASAVAFTQGDDQVPDTCLGRNRAHAMQIEKPH
jgi:hypothetical protein